MERFHYSRTELDFIESCSVPFAVFQFVDKRVVVVALSAGALEFVGTDDREEAYRMMHTDMYRNTHPEDVARQGDMAVRFATEGGEYDHTYRSLINGEYHIVHARGKHFYTKTGVRLGIVWYSDEGLYLPESSAEFKKALNEELQKTNINLKDSYDPMTGLPGISYFYELAEAGRAALLKMGENPACLFFDFNGMKNFNIRHGFSEGDKLILEMSKILKRHFSTDNCCRIGGDRFAVFTKEDGLEKELEDIFEECKNINNGVTLPLRVGIYLDNMGEVRIGIACDRAKMACDINRNSPVSGFNYFKEDLLKEIESRQYIIEHLDQAIREKWIQVYYQPIIRSSSGRVCDEEALARWIDPARGFLSPADFIPILEDAGLIYKLDLYVTEQLLEKMKKQSEAGLFVVPCSVNISRSDFETCDIVEEIRKRVDDAGISRDMLTIEITESLIGEDFTYMKRQVDRFHELGFAVWMDDYGSGYSSPEILQIIPFDTIKLDMQFIRQYEKNKKSGIIISGLVKMAISLGMDTVIEGVETAEQTEFLKEIGCTKMQGFYFNKPIPFEQILELYQKGEQVGFENPAETGYYKALGKVNLYDLSLSAKDNEQLVDYFDTMPVAIMELDDEIINLSRANKSFRNYVRKHYLAAEIHRLKRIDKILESPAAPVMKAFLQCAGDGKQLLMDEKTREGKLIRLLIRRIAVNAVTGTRALLVVVLGVMDENSNNSSLTYTYVAQALSADYVNLYYVNLENDHFIEYQPDARSEEMAMERKDDRFFERARTDAMKALYEEDREGFVNVFTKENIVGTINEHGAFTYSYRLLIKGKPVYVNLKAIYIGNDKKNIIIGVSNVDAQMRDKEALAHIREERTTYSRLMALSGDYISFFTVDLENNSYFRFNARKDFESLETASEGEDFFKDAVKDSGNVLYKDDIKTFQAEFTKEKILKKIEEKGIFQISYRLVLGGIPKPVCLKAALVNEDGRRKLIVGIQDVGISVEHVVEQMAVD